MNSHNQLASLTDDQLDQVYEWLQDLTCPEVIKKIADTFGISVNRYSLGRFFRRRRAEIRAADSIAISKLPSVAPAAQFHEAAGQSFAHLTYETADSPAAAKYFIHLSNWFARRDHNEIKRQYLEVAKLQATLAAERLELERQRHQLETWKAQTNLARLSLEHVAKLQSVLHDQTTDDQDKIELGRQIVCGPNAVPTPFEPLSKPR